MPFRQPFDNYYHNILRPVLTKNDFMISRSDEIYGNRPIIDDIIDQIIDSDVIIADVSGKNPNVNYELGVAHALRKNVIIISQNIKDIPFDYRHLRTIIYDPKLVNWSIDLKRKISKTVNTLFQKNSKNFELRSLEEFYDRLSWDKFLGLKNLFSTRQAMNIHINDLWHRPVSQLDIIAFGLKSFRDYRNSAVVAQVKNGLKIRILTLNPNSPFLKQRERDEKLVKNSIRKTIIDLEGWCKNINKEVKIRNAIKIKFYDSLPLDFYWRQDDSLFVGPYLYGIDSQQTVTYNFSTDSSVGNFYSIYFEKLWNNRGFSSNTY